MWNKRSLRVLVVGVGVCAASFLAKGILHAPNKVSAQSGHVRVSLPQDWSHRHVVFSSPGDLRTLVAIRQEPRLFHQWLRANVHAVPERSRQLREQVTGADHADLDDDSENDQKRGDWSVTLGQVGAIVPRGMYPAKFSFDINAPPNCVNDFVVFPTSNGGSANQANIVAYNRLYSTQGAAGGFCNHNGPVVKWAYNTGRAIRSSPVLSLDGTKVGWNTSTAGIVHSLLIGTTGNNGASVTAPVSPGVGNNAVDKSINLSGGRNITSSALYVDYDNDVAYIGDNGGVLHKITGMFNGTLTEVVTGGWPITVSGAGSALTAPVFDSTSRNIFVTDAGGHLSYVREVGSASGACSSGAPPCLGSTVLSFPSGAAIADGPIIDSSTGRVFTESGNADGVHAQLVQTDTALGSVVRVNVGAQDGNALRGGTFDNNYFNSISSGFFYFCGKNFANSHPTLYRIGFNAAGVMNSAINGATPITLATGPATCSPLAEIYNNGSSPAHDWLFVSVSNHCAGAGGGAGGCIMSFDITNGMPAAATKSVTETNGTSGIIIDNVSPVAQASSVYFSNEANGVCNGVNGGGCAIKRTQNGLN